jgi:hypothetical protein
MWGYRPWLLGPVLLLRRRAVLVALRVASAVSAVPVAAAPLFLSAAQCHAAPADGAILPVVRRHVHIPSRAS